MLVQHLSLVDFRSYTELELSLPAGPSVLLGANGQGKTNVLEALGYLAGQGSHRVALDAPLVRRGASRAVLRSRVLREDRELLLELELNPGRANRARLNRAPLSRPRELVGVLRTVLFAPEDLALVKGDPDGRRRFLDDVLFARAPRLAGVRADYDRVIRQRSALLKSAGAARRSAGGSASVAATLDVWDAQLARHAAVLVSARLALVDLIAPLLDKAHAALVPGGETARAEYAPRVALQDAVREDELEQVLLAALREARPRELERGVCLVGPHRDDLLLSVGELPARGYASHGESWSVALALRLASAELLRADGAEPVLLLDDVFAELDAGRRARLAALVAGSEQVVLTAAVDADVPAELRGARFTVTAGRVNRAG